MRALVAWLVILSIFISSYLGSFAYFYDSYSLRASIRIEQATVVQISYKDPRLIPCPCNNYLLKGIIINTTREVTLEGVYFESRGWTLRGIIIDNQTTYANRSEYIPLNITLTPKSYDVSLILHKSRQHRGHSVMYVVFYIEGKEYPISLAIKGCQK